MEAADLLPDFSSASDLVNACGGGVSPAADSAVTADTSCSDHLADVDSSASSSSKAQLSEWTNEKHNLYLDLLERSFVDELNHSKRLRGAALQEVTRHPYSQELPVGNNASFHEFKVPQGVCFQKIKCPRTRRALTKGKSCPHNILQKDDEEVPVTGNIKFSWVFPGTSEQRTAHHICHRSSINDTAEYLEVSDQNFVNGDRSSAYSSVSKRSRRISPTGPSNHQLVPSGETYKAHGSICGFASSRKRQGHQKLLSGDPN